jgi:hypothetical protein
VKAQETRSDLTVVTPQAYECFGRKLFGKFSTVRRPPFERPLSATSGSAYPASQSATPNTKSRLSYGASAVQTPDVRDLLPGTDTASQLTYDSVQCQAEMTAQANLARRRLLGVVLPTPTRLPRNKYGDLLCKRPRSICVGSIILRASRPHLIIGPENFVNHLALRTFRHHLLDDARFSPKRTYPFESLPSQQ